MLSKLFYLELWCWLFKLFFPFLLNVLISCCSSSAKIKVKKVPQIIYRRKIGEGDDNYDLSRCSLRMHNNLRKWEKNRFIKKRENYPKFNTANQQISSGKDIKFERHQYFSAVTKLLFMLMCQLDLCMCVHNLFLTTDVIIKAVQEFWFSLCTIFRRDLDIMVKVCDKFVKVRNAGFMAVKFHHCEKRGSLPNCVLFGQSEQHWRNSIEQFQRKEVANHLGEKETDV